MPRDKYIDTNARFLAVDLAKHATGATAYSPSMLLQVVLCAYARAIVNSRGIERAWREHVTFGALCGDAAPHFTTTARFISTLGDDIAHVFAAVLAVCDREGLIGREMFGEGSCRAIRLLQPMQATVARQTRHSSR